MTEGLRREVKLTPIIFRASEVVGDGSEQDHTEPQTVMCQPKGEERGHGSVQRMNKLINYLQGELFLAGVGSERASPLELWLQC